MLVVPLRVIAIDFWALSSYGTRLQTLFSWTGQISPLNTVSLTDDMIADAKADKRYLLFKMLARLQEAVLTISLIVRDPQRVGCQLQDDLVARHSVRIP